jgi:hypothetical protein
MEPVTAQLLAALGLDKIAIFWRPAAPPGYRRTFAARYEAKDDGGIETSAIGCGPAAN